MNEDNHKKLRKELGDAFASYQPELTGWLSSPYCFVTQVEMNLLAHYITFRDLSLLAKQYVCDEDVIVNLIQILTERLKRNINFYRKYCEVIPKLRESAGYIDTTGAFLSATLVQVLPKTLFAKFAPIGNNMGEILSKYSAHDIQRLRQFGPVKVRELKKLLATNGCSALLAKDKKTAIKSLATQ
jgi:hypothetical protein